MVIDGEPRMACVTDSRPEAISAETAGHWPAVTVLFSELRCASSPQCFGTAFGLDCGHYKASVNLASMRW